MFEREIRDLSHVPRWTIARTIRQQNVAEHSFYVAVYALQIAKIINWSTSEDDLLALTSIALIHDLHESFTGDTPGPVKRSTYAAGQSTEWIAAQMNARFANLAISNKTHNGDEINAILKAANLLDELFFLAGEKQMGNKSINALIGAVENRTYKAWLALPGYNIETLSQQWDMYVQPAYLRELLGNSEVVENDSDLAI